MCAFTFILALLITICAEGRLLAILMLRGALHVLIHYHSTIPLIAMQLRRGLETLTYPSLISAGGPSRPRS